MQDPNGNRITATYSGGLLTRLTHSNGSFLTLSYTNGLLTQLSDSSGRTSRYTYDATGQHLLTYTDEFGTTTYSYVTGQGAPAENALASITFADNSHRFFRYDSEGRLIDEHRDNNQEDLSYSYAPLGGYTTTDAKGAQTTVLLDDSGRTVQATDALGNVIHFLYDASGDLTQVNGPLGMQASYAYDLLGDVTSATDTLGLTTHFSHDSSGRLLSYTDARNNTTQYRYDGSGDLLAITYPNGSLDQFQYDPLGNRTQSLNARGRAIRYQYNNAGQVVEADFADGSQEKYTYDSRGNLRTATNTSGTITYQYQNSANPDLVTEIDYPGGLFLKFTYNVAGQRTQSVDQTGFTINYQYDALGRLQRLTDGPNNLIVQYSYDGTGQLIQKDLGNGTRTTYQYDPAGNLLKLVNLAADHGTVNSEYDYTHDALGRVLTMTSGGATTSYGYDADGQLTSINTAGLSIQYTYDAAGNRLTETVNGVTTNYTANNLNEYTAVGGTTYQYDADGNLISKTDSTGTTIYTFNDQNQMTGVTGPGLSAAYGYDPLGNRNSQTINGATTRFLIDPTSLGNVASEYTGSGSLIAHYSYGLGLTSRVDASGKAAYYDFDATGDTIGMTNAVGSYVNRYSYLPFGKTTILAAALPNAFTFVGQSGVSQDGSGLLHMGFRSYDPVTGQFTSNDPLGLAGGDGNIRRYGLNSPTNLIDPTGLDAENPVLVPSDYWTKLKLYKMNDLMNHFPGNPNDPYPGLDRLGYLAAGVFDSPFWGGPAEQRSFTFQDGPFAGMTLKGYEVNYYFQGMIARRYGLPLGALYDIIYAWKAKRRWLDNNPNYTWPTLKELYAATAGYLNYTNDLTDWIVAVLKGTKITDPGDPPSDHLTEGTPATFVAGNLIWNGNPLPPPSAFTAKTVWSDGVTTTDQVAKPGSLPDASGVTTPGATYDVYATRAFPEAGAYAASGVTTIEGPNNTHWSENVAEIVYDAPMIVSPVNFSVPVGGHYDGPIATFEDLDPDAPATTAGYTVGWVQSSTLIPATIQAGPNNSYTVIADIYFSNSYTGPQNLIVRVWDNDDPGPNPRGGADVVDNVAVADSGAPSSSTSVYGQIMQVNSAQPSSGTLAVIDTTDPSITSADQVTVASATGGVLPALRLATQVASQPAGNGSAPGVLVTGATFTQLPGGVKQITLQGIVNAVNLGSGLAAVPLNIRLGSEPWLTAQVGVDTTASTFTVNPVPVVATAGQVVQNVPVATLAGPANDAYAASIDWGDGDTSAGQITALGGGQFSVTASKPHPYAGQQSHPITVSVSGPSVTPPPPVRTEVTVAAAPDDSARFLGGLYHDVLGRASDPAGVAVYLPAVDLAREQAMNSVTLGFVTSDENRSNLIRSYYQVYLGRNPSQDEINLWLGGLKDLSTPEQVRGQFASSPEYFAKQGGTNNKWLDQMYRDLLGRERDPGSQAFLDALNQGTKVRQDIVALIQDSTEYRQRVVNTVFTTYLGRPAGAPDFAIWVPVVVGPKTASGTPAPSEQFTAAVLASQEYLVANGDSVPAVITSLYRRVLGRAPEPAGFQVNLQKLLDGYAGKRQDVALAFATSQEHYSNLVSGFYSRYLGRTAGAVDLSFWVPALVQGNSTDEDVLAQIVGSDEYYRNHGGTNATWLDAMYQDLLGRLRGATETALLDALQHGATRPQVVTAILTSLEYRRTVIQGLYSQYLRRQGAQGELDFWAQALGQGTTSDEKIAAAVLGSAEYFQMTHAYP